MYTKLRNAVVAVGTGLALSAPAFAVIDVTDITDAIAEAGTAGATVGAAVVVMVVAIKVFKWLRSAL